jgi:hypothetical protein
VASNRPRLDVTLDARHVWEPPVQLSASAMGYHVAMNRAGDVITTWQAVAGGRVNLYARRYKVGTGWGATTLVDTEDLGDVKSNAVAIDPQGNALVVWTQRDAQYDNVWQRRHLGSSGSWQAAAKLETTSGSASVPVVAMDASGNAIAAWAQALNFPYKLWYRRYSPSTGWAAVALLDAPADAEGVPNLSLATDSAGATTAVWIYETDQQDYTPRDLFASRYTFETGWTPAVRLEQSEDHAYGVSLAVAGAGNAIAMWSQSGSTWSSLFRATDQRWASPFLVEAGGLPGNVALNEDGKGVGVWQAGANDIRSRRIASNGLWTGTAETIESETYGAWVPRVAIDGRGYAFAIFLVETPAGYVTAHTEYYPTLGWDEVELGPLAWGYPWEVVANEQGAAAYAWSEGTTPSGTVRARLFR